MHVIRDYDPATDPAWHRCGDDPHDCKRVIVEPGDACGWFGLQHLETGTVKLVSVAYDDPAMLADIAQQKAELAAKDAAEQQAVAEHAALIAQLEAGTLPANEVQPLLARVLTKLGRLP